MHWRALWSVLELESALLMIVIMIGFMTLLGDSCHCLRASPGELELLTRIWFKVHLLDEQKCKSRSPLCLFILQVEIFCNSSRDVSCLLHFALPTSIHEAGVDINSCGVSLWLNKIWRMLTASQSQTRFHIQTSTSMLDNALYLIVAYRNTPS